MIRTTSLLAFLLIVPSPASADAVSPPPAVCPDSSTGATCHGPPHCAPDVCHADSDCDPGLSCLPAQLCIQAITCGGWGGSTPAENVMGSCATGACSDLATCTTRNVCRAPAPSADAGPDGGVVFSKWGCCNVAGARGAAGGLVVLPALLFFVWVRRRSRR